MYVNACCFPASIGLVLGAKLAAVKPHLQVVVGPCAEQSFWCCNKYLVIQPASSKHDSYFA